MKFLHHQPLNSSPALSGRAQPSAWLVASLHGALLALLVFGGVVSLAEAAPSDEELFETKVRPLLAERCFRCHGGEKTGGELRVDSREALLKGGESGPAIVPHDPQASLLVKALQRADDVSAMPPDKPVDAAALEAVIAWIKAGAHWPASTAAFRHQRHWAFEPVRSIVPPAQAGLPAPVGSMAIDALSNVELAQRKVTPFPKADKRTLIRRVTYDLTGLPPTPAAVKQFLADDSADAFEKLVNGLLASPAYGEQAGRQWLDVVRYADTAGENSDHPLPHAWRYRNWVIQAFNQDKPYNEFLQEQLAGDILAGQLPPPTASDAAAVQAHDTRYKDLIIATGYLAIARRFGHDIDKDIHLTQEDVIDTFGKSMLGLTIACARCHSHKYDPISHDDYYALYGIFNSTKFAFPGCEPKQQPRDLVPLVSLAERERMSQQYQQPVQALEAKRKEILAQQTTAAQKMTELRNSASRLLAEGKIAEGGQQPLSSNSPPDSTTAPEPLPPVAVQPGELIQLAILPLSNHGADSTLVELEIAEVGGEQRKWNLTTDVLDNFLAGNPHPDRQNNPAVWCFLDLRPNQVLLSEPIRDLSGKVGLHVWRNGETPSVFINSSPQPIDVWTKLPAHSLFAHPAPDGNVGLGWISPLSGTVRITGRVADAHPGGADGIGWQLTHTSGNVGSSLQGVASFLPQLAEIDKQQKELIANTPPLEVAFAVSEGEAKNVRLHERGDPEKLGHEVPRRWLELFGAAPLPPEAGSGRLQLAQWVTRADNPLTARVMVNRIWQAHFGQGLVKTPNDFGTRGQVPTHPDLLDWLAGEFVRSGWSVKHLHRTILLSETYQRASDLALAADSASAGATTGAVKANQQLDPENQTYWHFSRRRLSAEEIRDSLLVASNQLDASPGGAHPFPAEASWGFTQHNPFAAVYETNRRSVYLMVTRNRRHPFLGLFDGADPNTSTPQRQATTVPTQALYFMNDPLVHQSSQRVAEALSKLPDDTQRISQLYQTCYLRPPTAAEQTAAEKFLASYRTELASQPAAEQDLAAWSAYWRILVGSNEFLFVE